MNYDAALAYLANLGKFGINLGLTRIERLLELMNHPEKCFRTIHVTGTNGKGSVTSMLTSVLLESGIKTGMYTSPHLLDYTERIQIDGQDISQSDFAEAILHTSQFVQQMTDEGWEHPTEFEVLTAGAFYFFAKTGVEYAVIEVGLGGLLDSTNVIVPEVSVITNVALEHTDRCGNTIEEIACHKAGIIKKGIPVVTAATDKALALIEEKARDNGSFIYAYGREFCATFKGFEGQQQRIEVHAKNFLPTTSFSVNLLGLQQVENSAVVLMSSCILAQKEKRIHLEAVKKALSRVTWPGRFELVQSDPPLVIDGAHNPHGAAMLRKNLDMMFPGKEIIFLLGILRDKDVDGIIGALIVPQDRVVVVSPISERAEEPHQIAAKVTASQVETADSILQGLKRVKDLAAAHRGVICVAGSLYLIGSVRKEVFS